MSYGGGGFMSGSQDSPGGSKKTKDTMTLRPVTIKQILESVQPHPDAEFSIDGSDVSQVTFVAKICNIVQGANNCSYSLEDGTGTIDVRVWIESEDDDTGATEGLQIDSLARVVGTMKVFSNRRSVNSAAMHPVTDFNEQQYHLLDAMYTHLVLTRGSLEAEDGRGGAAAGGASDNKAAAADAAADLANDIADPTSRRVMQYILGLGDSTTLPESGVNVEQIARNLKASPDSLMPHIEDLVSEGHLYTTLDEAHVLPTGA